MNLVALIRGVLRLPARGWIAWRQTLAETRIHKSLRGADAVLAFVAKGTPYRGPDLPYSTELLCPELTVFASGFDRYVTAVDAVFLVIFEGKTGRHELFRSTVSLAQRPNEIGQISIRWHGTSLADVGGEGAFKLLVADRVLAEFPVQLICAKELVSGVRVRDVRLGVVFKDGHVAVLPKRVVSPSVSTIAPSFVLESQVLAPGTCLKGRLLLTQSGHVLAGVPFRVWLKAKQTVITTTPASWPAGIDSESPLELRIDVEGRVVFRHRLRIFEKQPITTFDGSLNGDAPGYSRSQGGSS